MSKKELPPVAVNIRVPHYMWNHLSKTAHENRRSMTGEILFILDNHIKPAK